MSALTVLTVGVSLVFGLQAMDAPAGDRTAEWATRQQAARVAIQLHDYKRAVDLFQECVGLSQTRVQRLTALSSYGIALNRMGRNVEAKAALERVLAEWGNDDDESRVLALGVLSSVERSLGDYERSEQMLRAALGDRSATAKQRATLMVNLTDLLRE
jgi:tetratricopeptide (TPR) repeat protein